MTTPATWNAGSGNWFTALNWNEPNPNPPPDTLHHVPNADNDVSIPNNNGTTPFTVTYAGTSTINTLAGNDTGLLDITSGSLTILNGGAANRQVDKRPVRQRAGIPPGGTAVVRHGNKRPAHPKCPVTNGFNGLGRRHVGHPGDTHQADRGDDTRFRLSERTRHPHRESPHISTNVYPQMRVSCTHAPAHSKRVIIRAHDQRAKPQHVGAPGAGGCGGRNRTNVPSYQEFE